MPKKKTPVAVPRGLCHVRLDLTPAQRDRLRVLAATSGMSMAAFARAVVVREIERAQ